LGEGLTPLFKVVKNNVKMKYLKSRNRAFQAPV
jgi:hypothetical protein